MTITRQERGLRTAGSSRTGGARLDVAILDAEQRQCVVCVRELGRRGLRVGAFSSNPRSPAFSSRWCATSGILPDCSDDPDAFIAAVLDLVDRHSPRVLITAHDGPIEALRARRSEIEGRVGLALAQEPGLGLAVDKSQTLVLAEELGIPVPRTVGVGDVRDLASAVDEVGLPAVAKPARSWVSRNQHGTRLECSVVVDREEARATVERMLEAGGSVVLQEWLPGRREAIWLVYAEQRIWARFAQVAHRMHPPLGGSSVVRESIPLPRDLVDASEALVRAAGLEGYCEVEFRRDAEGRPRLMEINPRLSASLEVAVRAGMDFPWLVYAWAAGLPLQEQRTYRHGVRMRWLGGDLRWLRVTLRTQGRPDVLPAGRALATFLTDSFRPAAYDYVTASDLRPAAVAAREFLLQAARLRRSAKAAAVTSKVRA